MRTEEADKAFNFTRLVLWRVFWERRSSEKNAATTENEAFVIWRMDQLLSGQQRQRRCQGVGAPIGNAGGDHVVAGRGAKNEIAMRNPAAQFVT